MNNSDEPNQLENVNCWQSMSKLRLLNVGLPNQRLDYQL